MLSPSVFTAKAGRVIKETNLTRNRKSIFISISIISILGILIGVNVYSKFKATEIVSSTSPDGEYKIVILEKKKWISMPGDGSSRCVKIELSRGFWRIEQECDNCPTFSSEVGRPKWDMEAMQVYYAPARSVNLITGKCEQ
jgi:hypothetical protein